ncbi:MAG: hypothetical protein U0746_19485 [Gemmataceae bacterium]
MRCPLRVTRLEDRRTPAIVVWDGGGFDAKWSTAGNWVGDVAPRAGDSLTFPAGPARLANVNDFAAGTAFGEIDFTGLGYQVTGNAIVLSNGVRVDLPTTVTASAAELGLALTFTADGSITASSGGLTVSGAVDLGGHTLSVYVNGGPVRFTAAVASGSVTQSGTGTVTFDGPSYPAGGITTLSGATYVNATNAVAPGPVTVYGTLGGTGVVGDVSVWGSAAIDPTAGNAIGTLTTGNLTVGSVSTFGLLIGTVKIDLASSVSAVAADKLVVHGTVSLSSGTLVLGTATLNVLVPGLRVTIIDNDGTDSSGTFYHLPEGSVVTTIRGVALRITYKGGDGNDVELFADKERTSLAVGAGEGGLPVVNVYGGGGNLLTSFLAYGAGFRGGVRVATADVTGDGIKDVITAAGVGGGPHIKVFDGVTFALVREFLAYDASFTGGVWVAAGDVNGDGSIDIVTGAGAGGGPHVKVFDATTLAVKQSFFAYDASFAGGVTVAVFGFRVATGPGVGGGPVLRVFNGGRLESETLVYDAAFRGGLFVTGIPGAGTRVDTVAVAPGVGGVATVVELGFVGFRNVNLQQLTTFQAFDARFTGGTRLAAADLDGDGIPELAAAPGAGGGPLFAKFKRADPTGFYPQFAAAGATMVFDPGFLGGLYVG